MMIKDVISVVDLILEDYYEDWDLVEDFDHAYQDEDSDFYTDDVEIK